MWKESSQPAETNANWPFEGTHVHAGHKDPALE
jgi:hypothetical protein